MRTLLRLSRLIAPLFPVMTLAVLFGTLGFFCAIGIPVVGVLALTKTLPVKFLVLVGLGRGILHYAEQYCNHFIAFTLLARIRNIVFDKLRSLGPAKLDGKEKGNLISLLTSDIELLELFYAHTVSPVCIAILVSGGVLIFLAHYHFALALVALISFILLAVFTPFVIQKISISAGEKHRELFACMNSFLLDSLRGLQQTILYGNGAKKRALLLEKSEELSKSQKNLSRNEGITAALIDALLLLCDMAMLFTAIYLYRHGSISFDGLLISVAAFFSSFGPVVAVARLGSSLSQTVAAGKRVLSLLDESPLAETVENESDISHFEGGQISNLNFAYNKEAILRNLSLSFPKNQIIGLQGKSGSGKSTILKLLMRFWKADSGSIKISEKEIDKINTASLRSLESYVTQETVLFHDTIENNIRIARLNASREEIIDSCKRAAIHDFIISLPNGYDTQVGELGENFSGGERQRLSLARAFLHDGEFLLLDEPTSNLDSYNEKIILDSAKAERSKKTVLLVSHRESTMEVCDKIYKIESGRLS